jgi:hemolysin III
MQDATLASDRSFSLGEEIAHSVTHGFGILLSIAGLAVLVAFASRYGTARDVVGAAVFGSSLVLLYTASTLYHSIQTSRARPILRLLDHSSIYLLIAGTYTPIALRKLPAATGAVLLAVLWTAALVGIVLTATLRQRFRAASMVLYVGMGWSALLVAGPLARAMGGAGMALIVAGGVAYTIGIAFYGLRRMPYHHLVWHLFVLAGSVLHYFAVLLYVTPRPLVEG